MDLHLNGIKQADLPVGLQCLVLVKGPDAYCSLRTGDTVNFVLEDGSVSAPAAAVSIGPMLNYFPSPMLGLPTHFAIKPGQDGRSMVDALEKQYPGDASAIDPRTIFSAVTVAFPSPAPVASPLSTNL